MSLWVNSELTFIQNAQFKAIHEEIKLGKENDENNLIIKYSNRFITKFKEVFQKPSTSICYEQNVGVGEQK